jgi:hypothetical protein
MGSFSPLRVPESKLRMVWDYISDIGFRPAMQGRLSAGVPSATGVTYTLDVENAGVIGRGLTAENLTITLRVPEGTSVVATTGTGYQGVRRDEEAKANIAAWRVPRMAPRDRQTYTITLSQPATAQNNLRGSISWTKPVVKTGPADSQAIAPAPTSGGGQ